MTASAAYIIIGDWGKIFMILQNDTFIAEYGRLINLVLEARYLGLSIGFAFC